MGLINDFRSYYQEVKEYQLEKKSVRFLDQSNSQPILHPIKFLFGKNKNLVSPYEHNTDAYSVLRKIIDVFKGVEWIVEQKQKEGQWVEVYDTTINDLIKNPNPSKNYTMQDIDEQMLVYLFGNGNSYLYGETLSGKIAEIDVLPSANIQVKTSQNFFLPNPRYKFEIDGTKRTFTAEELEHTLMFNPSYSTIQESYNGLSVFDVAKYVIEVGNDKWEADAHLLKNRGIVGMITNKGSRPMVESEALKIQSAYDRDNSGTKNFGKIRVTNQDLSYIQMGMSATDLELVKKGVITLRAMCNVFGLDSSLFNDPDNKTYNNRKEAEKAMYTNVIIPLAEKIAYKHTKFIAENHYPEGNYRIRKNFEYVSALQSDLKEEAEKDKIVMEGVNVVLNMPISQEAKIEMLKEHYQISEDILNKLTIENNE